MASLILALTGPLQSWGTSSRLNRRDSAPHPTHSGVVGLCAAALGRPRGSDLEDLATLGLVVRVDQPGVSLTDYHIVSPRRVAIVDKSGRLQLPRATTRTGAGALKTDNVLSRRAYLSDAKSLVILEGDRDMLDPLAAALRRPHWPPALGRRACPPDAPLVLGRSGRPALELAATLPSLSSRPEHRVRLVVGATHRPVLEAAGFSCTDVELADLPTSSGPRYQVRSEAWVPATEPGDAFAVAAALSGGEAPTCSS